MITIKTKSWIILLGSILLLSLIALLLPQWMTPSKIYAEIYLDGTLQKTIPLSNLSEPLTVPVKDGKNENIILAEHGSIRMKSANCPDKLCVHQGPIRNSSASIVCLPHRLVIQIKGGTPPVDAISQ